MPANKTIVQQLLDQSDQLAKIQKRFASNQLKQMSIDVSGFKKMAEEHRVATEAFRKALLPQIEAAKALQQFSIPRFEVPTIDFKSILGDLSPAIESLQRHFRELPPRTKRALLTLAKHGWYLDPDWVPSDIWELEQALEAGDAEQAEKLLVEYYEKRLNEIETSALEAFPERARILSIAFEVHRAGHYAASIPLFLAQVDGICKDVTDGYLFQKHSGKPQTAKYVERIAADRYPAALLSPLSIVLPLGESEAKRAHDFSGLSRHMVLHGENHDYDTSVNGYKVVSLIRYLSYVLTLDDEDDI